ncbi:MULTISPECIES: DUF2637 domain-containing protein [Kocuria]|uniref:DUF2637 domain-containing protein n=1 Tax=Kocuria TaxID=57493 RepID=UPI0008A42680|nr:MULTISPECIES: DUF2637 domain-containing protein [Kocuria]OFK07298.1 hypothetical protein HMPREF2833_10910 [Kocuria sp. HMSC066H03]PKZ39388.1 DUF2637 domain-containing protein [Kocuria rhizophila]
MVGQARWGWAVVSAATGTIGIAAGAFWLSFIALADLAARSGITAEQAWVWPLLVDGLIVVATVAVVALDRHRAAWYPWALLIAGALVSVTANAAHALVAADATVPGILAGIVAAVPPLVLLASTHLTVVLIRSTAPAPATSMRWEIAAELPESSAFHAAATSPPGLSSATDLTTDETPSPEVPDAAVPSRDAAAVRTVHIDLPNVPDPLEKPDSSGSSLPRLGRRERALALRDAGWSNKKIAADIGVHASTVGRWFARLPDTTTTPPPEGDPLPAAVSSTSAANPAGALTEGTPS